MDNSEDFYSDQELTPKDDADIVELEENSNLYNEYESESFAANVCNASNADDSLSDAIKNMYAAKRFRGNVNTPVGFNDVTSSSLKVERLEDPTESVEQICDDGDEIICQSLAYRLEDTLDRANVLLSKLSYIKESKNRPFIENLLQDMNKLPEPTLRRIKWKISNIVYRAYQEQKQRNNSVLDS